MSDLSLTAANVLASATAITENGTAGEAITAGQAVYYDSTTRTYGLAKANGASATIRTGYGIALNTAPAAGQPLRVLKSGVVALGAVLTAGQLYVLSGANAGGIAPVGDLTTGWYTTHLGIAQTTSNLLVRFVNGGTAHA